MLVLYAFGEGEDGQLGLAASEAPEAEAPRIIEAGSRSSFAVDGSGSLWAWGWNVWRSLGVQLSDTCVRVPANAEVINSLGTPVKEAKIGGWHSAVLLVDGTVYTFGGNSNGQLGIGLDDDKNSAPFRDLRMGAKRMRLRTVSDNSITADHSKGQRLPGPHKVKIPSGRKVNSIACTGTMTFAVADGRVFWTGSSDVAAPVSKEERLRGAVAGIQFGMKELSPSFFDNLRVKEVAGGSCHALALTEEGVVFSWGRGEYGQLGVGGTDDKATPQRVTDLDNLSTVSVKCGAWHSGAMTAAGELYLWGRGEFGRLGNGSTASKLRPSKVPLKEQVTVFSLGGTHSAAIAGGSLYTWGRVTYGRLGVGKDIASEAENDCLSSPIHVNLTGPATFVSCGGRHTLVVVNVPNGEDAKGDEPS